MSSSEEDVISGSGSSEDERERKRSNKGKSKKSKHHKRSKSHRKEKKSKKSHKRRKSPSSSESSDSVDEWVTKEEVEKPKVDLDGFKKPAEELGEDKPKAVERDEWMNFGSILPTYSNDSKRAQRQAEKNAKREQASIEQLGQSKMELNPYWKDGGTGLPSEESEGQSTTKSKSSAVIGDGGLHWLRKAFLRAKEQAQEEGRSLEEIAEERWGSLQKFYEMLEEAERKAGGGHSSSRSSARESSHHSHRSDRRREKFQKPRYHSDSDNEDERRSRKYSRHDERRETHSSRKSYADSQSRGSGGWRKHQPETVTKTVEPVTQQKPSRDVEVEELPQSTVEVSEEPKEVVEEVKVLTDKEMNELSAKILKAEMLGNEELLKSLKERKEAAETARKNYVKTGEGDTRPTKTVIKVVIEDKGAGPRRKIRDKPGETHKDGQRVRYFPDDDRQTLKNMFEAEKRNTVENENALFSRLAGKRVKATEDYDMDDIFADRASSSKTEMKEKERELREILDEDKVYKKTLEGCHWCFDGSKLQRNLVIATGEKSFLCLPPYQSLTEGHCLLVPMYHVSSATQLDEDVWEEMQKFRRAIVTMFSDMDQDVVIFESALNLKKHPHMYLECVPMPKETGELAPIYFKKAIQECETEWSQNKKLVDLRNRNVRKAVPKGLPYFAVDFGMDSGFAHVVEDERYFPRNFAQEIVGGMLELDHHLWRKQKQDDFKTQRDKVMAFLKFWGPYDWTRNTAVDSDN